MHHLYELIRMDREYTHVLSTYETEHRAKKPLPMAVNGLSFGGSDAFLCTFLTDVLSHGDFPIVLLPEEKDARRVAELLTHASISSACFFSRDRMYVQMSASHDAERERMLSLYRIASGEAQVLLATPMALFGYMMDRERFLSLPFSLSVGEEKPQEDVTEALTRMGYTRVETVDGCGQYARRGDIVDVFPSGAADPYRIEWFGDEVDRIGVFSVETQRLLHTEEQVRLLPEREVLYDAEDAFRLMELLRAFRKKAKTEEARERISRELACLERGGELGFFDKYLSVLYPQKTTVIDLLCALKGTPTLILSDTSGVYSRLEGERTLILSELAHMTEDGVLPPDCLSHAMGKEELAQVIQACPTLHLNPFAGGVHGKLSGLFGFRSRRTVSYGGRWEILLQDLENYQKTSYLTFLSVQSREEGARAREMIEGAHMTARFVGAEEMLSELPRNTVYLTLDAVSTGFELMMPRVAVLSLANDGEGQLKKSNRPRYGKKQGAGDRIFSFAELSVGDYVVHAAHGIGQFEGITTLTQDGITKDYITILYAGGDKIFLPAERLELVSKYIGAKGEDGAVKLSKVGGTDWQKAKNKAKNATREMAKELIALYAQRERTPGYAYPPESEMEREFDLSFEFEDTPAQVQATADIKRDMEKSVPMDRLLCGDVGFGKTEVALRAAFKAICGGKQVAMLVPTTVLALQHYTTALSRMRGHAVNVEMLSRFRTASEQTSILRRLKRGEIDLLIGTHVLLGKRVEFRDLGLLIVDEEQRFGVGQKEKIKQMSRQVDVLTLTATPIPRTLNMAMSGIRDMSILDDPPSDRLPVQSYVLEHDDALIREALRRELSRGGQVLYLYNRVETIHAVASRLQRELPEARIAYAHGQMEHEELEDIWQELVRGEIDILVCTTIIETGVDLPNANTLVIEGADRMGLSQLHQIRGRVGRGGRQAYAYFTYRRGKSLSEIAQKRLEAIRAYAEFGAGFRIALCDLEIRGAGNLLGAEQHGHIDGVGYEMYIRLLNEAILEEKGERVTIPETATIDLACSAYLPESYIPATLHRMDMYKKISLLQTEADHSDILDEMCDRYGAPPPPALALLDISLLRATASYCSFTSVRQKEGELRFSAKVPNIALWSEVFCEIAGLRFSVGTETPEVLYRMKRGEDAVQTAKRIALAYAKAKRENVENANKA